ncbi:MAG TPA: carboxypeptidase regulatory-like domain-containing protein [Bryobacteraceae bacterium]|jgi:hypothetical protein
MSRYSVLLAFCLSPAIVLAQDVTGSISGSVTDPANAAIVGATVRLVSDATAAAFTAATNVEGNFIFTAVKPGIYSVSAEHPGFKKFEKAHFELTPGEKIAIGTLVLPVGSVNETIEVTAEGTNVQTATSERSGIVTSQEIENLTVINRDFTSFAELQPGVVITVGAQVQTFSGNNTFNVNGARATSNNIQIDGLPSNNTNQGNANTTISLDNTQTVEVKLSNFLAEYGRNNGATIAAVSKGGTQQYHGALYYYDRNEAFNANNFFNNKSGIAQTPLRVSYSGANLGGPLHLPHYDKSKNKMFFFISVENIQELRPKGLVTVTVPTALERQGNFTQTNNTAGKPVSPVLGTSTALAVKDPTTGTPFAGDIIPASRILPSMQNYLNLLPMANFTSAQDLAVSKGAYNYVYQESLNVPKWLDSARLDYNFTDKTQFYMRFNYWNEDQQGNAVSAGNTTWGWLPQHYTAITPSGVISLTHIFTPTLVFQGTMGYSQFSEAGPPLTDAAITAKERSTVGFSIPQLYPNSNPYNLVPSATFGVSDSANPSYASRFPLQGVENTYNWTASVTKIAGAHSMKFGIYPEHWSAMKGKNASNFAGNMNFSQSSTNPLDTGYAYSNALLGVLNSYTETSNRFPMYEFNTTFEWYAQDSWKVSRTLTVDMGVRWGWGTPWHPNHDMEAAFVPTTWNPQQAVKLIQPTLVNGTRMGLDPYTGAIVPAVTIGDIAPESPNQTNGIVNRLVTPSYPQGMRYTGGVKTGPHLGFSWDPFGKGKTVIRMGGAIFYNFHEVDNFGYGYQYSTPPLQYNPVIYYSYLTQVAQSGGYIAPSAVSGFNPARPIQQTYSYSAGFQHELGWATMLDMAYVGSLGRHLVQAVNLNSEPLGTDWQPQNLDATNKNAVLPSQFLRPYLGYGNITYYSYGGNSSYHSLQTQLRRRYKNNLTYGVIWTYSKTMDYSDTETSAATTQVSSLINPKIWNYGDAGYDHTHILRIYATYSLPRASSLLNHRLVKQVFDNWQLSGIYTVQSGAPGSVSYGYSPSQDVVGTTTDSGRVNVVGPSMQNVPSGGYAFNPAAFAAPPYQACEVAKPSVGCWGDAGKYTFRGPGINNVDLSLFKNMRFTERIKGQLQVQTYNTLNHTQFTAINTSATFSTAGLQTNGAFGQYTAAANPRQMQMVLRITF